MSPNETLWRGDLVMGQSTEENERKCSVVAISSLEESKNNQFTFNWGPDTAAVQLKIYPKCALKKKGEDGKKVNLNKYLKNSQVLSVTWEDRDTNLISCLGHGQEKHIGYLKPVREDLTPVVLVLTEVENELKPFGFCVDNPVNHEQQDKVTIFRTFHSLLMSGVRQEESGMQILGNNDCRTAADKNVVQCVSEEEDDDEHQADDSLAYDSGILTRKISKQEMKNQISMKDRIGENQSVLQSTSNHCDYQRAKKKNLAVHLKKLDMNAINLTSKQLKRNVAVHLKKLDMNKINVNSRPRAGHQKLKHEEIKYKCNQCNYKATDKWHLLRHQRSKHEGVKYKCNQCDYQVTTTSSLVAHQRSKHEGIKYKCNQCDFQAAHKSSLLQHQQSKHEGIRYKCDQCDYQATQKSSLRDHQKSLHEGIKYECNQCDYQASHKSSLLQHKKSKHEGIRYKCNQCEYEALQRNGLLLHLKTKHEEKECN